MGETLNFRVDESQITKLRALESRTGLKRSQILRFLIDHAEIVSNLSFQVGIKKEGEAVMFSQTQTANPLTMTL